jgi:uncharacterized membrane protein YbhN (UPF0104 family)
MRDILFTVKQQKREICYIVTSLLLAFGFNVYSILFYGTEWKELYTQWLAMLVMAMIFYFLIVFIRLICWFIFSKQKKGKVTSQS